MEYKNSVVNLFSLNMKKEKYIWMCCELDSWHQNHINFSWITRHFFLLSSSLLNTLNEYARLILGWIFAEWKLQMNWLYMAEYFVLLQTLSMGIWRLFECFSLSLPLVLSISLYLSLFCLLYLFSVYLFKLQIIEIGINYPPIVIRYKSIQHCFVHLARDINEKRKRKKNKKK